MLLNLPTPKEKQAESTRLLQHSSLNSSVKGGDRINSVAQMYVLPRNGWLQNS
jgi:hypothetical protein